MSAGFQIKVKNAISPSLAKCAARLKDARPVLEAMGLELVSITKRAFTDSSLRPTPWPARKNTTLEQRANKVGKKQEAVIGADGVRQKSLLRKSGVLWQSIKSKDVTNKSVTVFSSCKKYAAVHQLGAVITPKKGKYLVFSVGGGKVFAKQVTIPARPFFPFYPNGKATSLAEKKIFEVARRKIEGMIKKG